MGLDIVKRVYRPGKAMATLRPGGRGRAAAPGSDTQPGSGCADPGHPAGHSLATFPLVGVQAGWTPGLPASTTNDARVDRRGAGRW